MKYSFTSLALAGLAAAAAVNTKEAAAPVSVSITPVGNTAVKAVITNNGNKGYNILHKGTILDKIPTNDFEVTKDSQKAEFHGVKLRLGKTFDQSAFTALQPGQSKEVVVDLAEVYGLDKSGIYDVRAAGQFRVAELGSTELIRDETIFYHSNPVSLNVDGQRASKVSKAIHVALQSRSTIQSDCSASQKSTIADGEKRCAAQANAAADAALNGSASKFQEYFKSTATADRQRVANRLKAVAKECTNTPGGVLSVHCSDVYNYCDPGTFAYTVSSDDAVVWCDQYWKSPMETTQCHGDDKTGTTIHEYTHASHVFSPGTDDYAYGYTDCSKLSRAKALENADTYEYYANAIHLGC